MRDRGVGVKIAYCVTAREGGTSLHHFVPSCVVNHAYLVKAGHKVRLCEAEGGELQSSRAEVVAQGRAWGADEYFLQDADMFVSHEVVLAMLAVDRPLVMTPYPRRHGEVLFDVETPPKKALRIHHRAGHRTVEVRGGGLGCALVRSDVVSMLYDTCQRFACGKRLELEAAGMFDNLYELRRTEEGDRVHRLGEDWSFFRRVEAVGFVPEALCDWSPKVVHAGVCADYAPALQRLCATLGCAGCGA